ncbi:MAG: citrate/2-methylcitrate synthase [Enterococcus viikkiensis]
MLDLNQLAKVCRREDYLDASLYKKHNVKKRLRDLDGKGVLAGLTNISTIHPQIMDGDKVVSKFGELRYRGIDINELVNGFVSEKRLGFEEVSYLLLFGTLPTQAELAEFKSLIGKRRTLPTNFTRDVIMKAPSHNIMNMMSRSVLTLGCYDGKTDDISIENVLDQSLSLIATFPMLAVYSYHAYNHGKGESMYIHRPAENLSTAEAILTMLRPDKQYTFQEAQTLDMALVLHMEHGGGNNSTFTTRVVTSSGTDTYSTIAAALGSLKGPKHGGANIKVTRMMEDLKASVNDCEDENEIRIYLEKILNKEAFDKQGLIYGMGHAVYAESDPRAEIFKRYVEKLAEEKGSAASAEFDLYRKVERLAPEIISEKRKVYKGVSANIDFFSGFVYHMLDLPQELYTPMFAIARIIGWSAHRIEELINVQKIIRPAYMEVSEAQSYQSIMKRN